MRQGMAIAAMTLGVLGGAGSGGFPGLVEVAAARSHEQVVRALGLVRRPILEAAVSAQGLSYPPRELTLVGLKQERRLEVWARAADGWKLVAVFPVLAASGGAGPKLRAGDLQVPEGFYRLVAFNPNSSYHLSLRVNYPNAEDLAVARAEGRSDLGGDIFIHGKTVSIGCLALGDRGIEELYILVADVGLAHVRVLLAPQANPVAPPGGRRWIAALYSRLRAELQAIRSGTGTKPS